MNSVNDKLRAAVDKAMAAGVDITMYRFGCVYRFSNKAGTDWISQDMDLESAVDWFGGYLSCRVQLAKAFAAVLGIKS